MKVLFVSTNRLKIKEAQTLLAGTDIEIVPFDKKLNELQTEDTQMLVKEKALKAFSIVGRPLIVEHTSLLIENLNGLPGGLTQIFWDKLEADKFSELFGKSRVIAITIVAYCDGMTIKYFEGEIKGTIAEKPRGDRSFQWDCIFVPDGYDVTFAEMGDEKNNISMRKIAFEKLAKHLKK